MISAAGKYLAVCNVRWAVPPVDGLERVTEIMYNGGIAQQMFSVQVPSGRCNQGMSFLADAVAGATFQVRASHLSGVPLLVSGGGQDTYLGVYRVA